MKFEPTNRFILVNPIEEKQPEKSLVYLPEGYSKPEAIHKACEVITTAGDSKFFGILKEKDIVLIEQRMLQKIELQGNQFYLILENYVLGRIKHEN